MAFRYTVCHEITRIETKAPAGVGFRGKAPHGQIGPVPAGVDSRPASTAPAGAAAGWFGRVSSDRPSTAAVRATNSRTHA
jgi:hypothetical protein